MSHIPTLAAAMAALLLSAAAAPAAAEERRLDEAEWSALAMGRTVHYLNATGGHHGSEHYNTDGVTAYWRWPDGACKIGSWEAVQTPDGDIFCFDWPQTGRSCWAHFLNTETNDMHVLLAQEDGQLAGEVMYPIHSVDDKPFPCQQGVS